MRRINNSNKSSAMRIDQTAVREAARLSEEKYCSVAAMLRKTATLTMRCEIEK